MPFYKMKLKQILADDRLKFLFLASGIFFSFFCFGIFQENLTTERFGNQTNENGEIGTKFKFTFTQVGIQSLGCWIFASVIGVVKSEPKDKTHFAYYICASLATSIAMFSSNKALLYISYPLQVIAKSAKPIPVMLFGLLIARKIYSIQRYCLILHLVIGVVLFMMGKKAEDDSKSIGNLFGIGEMLLILSLSMDGVLGGIQDKLRAIYTPSGRQMMVAMSAWSTLILFSGSIISGEIFDFFPFVIQNPIVLLYLLLLSVSCAIGQLFIFSMVSSFGPLACAIVTTMRKLFSVLYSIIFKGNESTFVQWCGVVLVFSALFADAASAKKSTPKMEKNTCDEAIEAMEIDQNIKVAEIQKLPI